MKNVKRKKKGFTLIELLATVTILGIITTSVFVSYNKYLANAKERYFKSQENTVTLSGKEYFTDYRSKLPKNIGEKTFVTIDSLYSKKYISRLKDYDGNICTSNDNNSNRVYSYKVADGIYLYYSEIDCNGYKTNADTKAPTIVFTPNKSVTNKNITVTMTVKDNVKAEYYSYDIIKNGAVIKHESAKAYTAPVTINLTEAGTYYIKAKAIDSSANVTEKTSGKYVIDRTPPDCTLIKFTSTNSSKPGTWQNKEVSLKITPHDDIDNWTFKNCFKQASNATSSICKVDGTNLIGAKTRQMKGAKSSIFKNNNYTDNGHIYGKVIAYDEAGNSCTINSSEYYVDSDPPVIKTKSITSKDSSHNILNVKIKMTITDRVDKTGNKIYYRLSNDNKTFSSWTETTGTVSTDWTLAGRLDGTSRTIYIQAKDELGNTTRTTINYTPYKECTTLISKSTTGSCSVQYGFGKAIVTTVFTDKYSNNKCKTTTSTTECCVNPKTTYGSWGGCSKTCGGGTQSRTVTVENCNHKITTSVENRACNTQDCCSDVTYKDGNSCTQTCGGGTKNQLAYSKFDGSRCPAKDKSSGGSSCNTQDCCKEVTYKDGNACTKSCGGGTKNQLAYSKYNNSKRCPAKDKNSGGSACNTQDCCSNITYKDGTSCSKSCGGGTKNRVAYSAYNNQRCSSQDQKSGGSTCNTQDCCSSLTYKDGAACTKSCGGGTKNLLAYSKYDGSRCPANDKSSGGNACNTQDCCEEVIYKDGSACTKSCGGGTKNQLAYSKYDNSKRCPAKDKNSGGSSCNNQDCCSNITYKDGTNCSKSCGGGTKNRVAYSAYNNQRCSGQDLSSGGSTCNTQDCCYAVTYKDGNACTKSCGSGTKNRLAYSKYNNARCSSKDLPSGGSACNTQDCCSAVTYKDGNACTKSCGGGTKNRLAYSKYNNTRCSSKDLPSGGSTCNTQDCCSSVHYKDGTSCTVSCGGGTFNKLAYSDFTNQRCSSKDQKSGGSACNTQSCCTGPKVTESSWSSCKVSGNTRVRTKTITTTYCDGTKKTETKTQDCCESVTYADGASCTASCGGGTKNRLAKSTIDGERCPAKDLPNGGSACNNHDCCGSVHYQDGSSCSASCGGGTKNRVAYSDYNNQRCLSKDQATGGASCNTQDCCSSVYYKDGTTCSKSCVGGTFNRFAYSNYNNQRCQGNDQSSGGAACNTNICCAQPNTTYGDWSSCSVKCGGGTRTRSKTVTKCDGSVVTSTQTGECNKKACPVKLADSAHICPEDQLKPTRKECTKKVDGKRVYNYNTLVITDVWVSGYKIRVKGYLRNNATTATFNAYQPNRVVCIADSNNVCVKELCQFSIATTGYAELGAKFCSFDSGAGATSTKSWAAGKYRVIVKNTSGDSDKWRFETTPYMVNLFEVK